MRPAAFGWALLGLLLLAGALRLAVVAHTFPARPSGDELYYVGTATNLAEGHGHLFNRRQRAFRPPAQSFLLSALIDVELRQAKLDPDGFLRELSELDPTHPDPALTAFLRPLLAAPLVLGVLLVGLTALLGRVLFDARTGLLAGAVAALYPTLVVFSHSLMSEPLFAVLVTGGLVLAVASRDRRSAPLAACAGILFGAATLTRELGGAIAVVCAVWGVATQPAPARRSALVRGALLCACAALIVLPWTWRNYRVFGRLVPVSTVGWFAAGEGNTFEHPDWLRPYGEERRDFKVRFFTIDDEMERVDYARAYTLGRIRAEQPLWLPRKLARSLGLLLTPDSVMLDRIRTDTYAGTSRATARALLVAHVVLYGLVLCGAALGVASARGAGRRSLALGVLGAVCAVHVLANATPRFRVPWLPLLMVYASHAALRGRELARPGARRALAAPLLALALLLWASGPFFAKHAAAVWSHEPAGPERNP